MPLEVPLEIESCPYIPITDDPISPGEVLMAMDNIKPNKSAGPSGIPPGVLKALPNKWIVFFATLFTIIFQSTILPTQWALSKLVVLYKKEILWIVVITEEFVLWIHSRNFMIPSYVAGWSGGFNHTENKLVLKKEEAAQNILLD